MKILLFIPLLCFAVLGDCAEKVYVTDSIYVMVRRGKGIDYKIISQIRSGESMTLLRADRESGYSAVRLDNGEVGWILSQYITKKPIARDSLNLIRQRVDELVEQNTTLKKELSGLRKTSDQDKSENVQLKTRSDQLNSELVKMRHSSSNALQVQKQRDRLQENVITLERELQKVKRDRQTLQDSSSQDWFMVGAGVLLAGIVLGLILPKISWRRRTGWNSF